MAVDFATGTQLFKIGSISGIDWPAEKVYCLKHAGRSIPFAAQVKAVVQKTPLLKFNVNRHRYIHHLSSIPIIDVEIRHIGRHPDAMKPGLRSSVFASDVWQGENFEPMVFPDPLDRTNIFHAIQEALPVLCFDDYGYYVQPTPTICRRVISKAQEWSQVANISGETEKASVILKAKTPDPIGWKEVTEQLEARTAEWPMQVEEILAEVLDLERGNLFYGHLSIESLAKNPRFWEVLRASYQTYYVDHYDCFESFLLLVVGQMRGRLLARQVHEKYSRY